MFAFYFPGTRFTDFLLSPKKTRLFSFVTFEWTSALRWNPFRDNWKLRELKADSAETEMRSHFSVSAFAFLQELQTNNSARRYEELKRKNRTRRSSKTVQTDSAHLAGAGVRLDVCTMTLCQAWLHCCSKWSFLSFHFCKILEFCEVSCEKVATTISACLGAQSTHRVPSCVIYYLSF